MSKHSPAANEAVVPNTAEHAAAHAKTVKLGAPTLQHVEKFAKELADAGIDTHTASPQLLPDYRNHKK